MGLTKRMLLKLFMLLPLVSCAVGITNSTNDPFLKNIGDGVYVHHGKHLDIDTGYQGDICNMGVIVGSKGVAVIDTGGSLKVGIALRTEIAKITKLPILYVINTHVHPDHIFGNAAFIADRPVFVGHVKLATAMKLRKEAYDNLNIKYLGVDAKGSEIVLPTLEVKDNLELDLGDRLLKLTAYPVAHTNTDITVIDTKTSTLFTGDLLFTQRTPVIEGDIKGLITVLDKLKSYNVKLVVPGHGLQTHDWQGAINDEQRYLNILLADIRANIKKGISMSDTMSTAAASERDKWVLFEVANRRNVNTIYPQLEWE
jgi:quinoprotein relay system zinc metallohydrolase 2